MKTPKCIICKKLQKTNYYIPLGYRKWKILTIYKCPICGKITRETKMSNEDFRWKFPEKYGNVKRGDD